MTPIYDLNNCQISSKNGMYLGQAGAKEGVIINGESWIIKYPKNTKGLHGELDSYTTSPLSEYIGSHIYKILGYDVHDTMLGIRNGKVVVACKDFCIPGLQLREIRALKNIYNPELEQQLEESLSSTGDEHSADLDEILIHLQYNPVLKHFPELTKRLWDCAVIDGLINNNDRNNGNWGLLYNEKADEYFIAPIYDNGAAFSNKMSEEKIHQMVENPLKMRESALNTVSSYSINGKRLSFRDLMQLHNKDLQVALQGNVPEINKKMQEIKAFINEIPEIYNGLAVCSKARKKFYIAGMDVRMEQVLIPAYEEYCQE